METTPVLRCPGDELLAAFSDGQVAEEQRDVLSAHLLLCVDCYQLFIEAAELRAEKET